MNERNDDTMHQPGADRTGSDRFKDDSSGTDTIREANENIRKAQGDDATGEPGEDRDGNRPRFDRDR
jgi:hypothetical protein